MRGPWQSGSDQRTNGLVIERHARGLADGADLLPETFTADSALAIGE